MTPTYSAEIDGTGTITLVIHRDELAKLGAKAWSDTATLTGENLVEHVLDNASEAGTSGRYVSSNGWTHIFLEGGRQKERETRWCYDRNGPTLTLDIKREHKWRASTEAERLDVLDSLLNGNAGCLDDPASWDFSVTAAPPEWAVPK